MEERWDDFHYVSTPAWRHSFLGPAGTPLANLKTDNVTCLTCADIWAGKNFGTYPA